MSFSMDRGSDADYRVAAGEELVLRVNAYDPTGISRIFIQCFQFSLANTNRAKLAMGEIAISTEEWFSLTSFNVSVPIPENAALGKWGVQLIEFTNARGFKTAFYRGQGKFDDIVFEVVAPTHRQDKPLRLIGVEIATQDGRV